MALRHRKLKARVEPDCVDLSTMVQAVRSKYPDLLYLGIWFRDGKVCFHVQNEQRMSAECIKQQLETYVAVADISTYSKMDGELQEEWRSKPARGKKRVVANAGTNAIFVHPLCAESMDHITREFVADLLQQFLNVGAELYSLEQNTNFRARKKYEYVRVRCLGGEWITVSKSEASDRILENLKEKAQEAVDMFRESIPAIHLNHFDMYAESILDDKKSHGNRRKGYEKLRNKGLDNIAVMVNDRLSRLRSWGSKKVKLV